jgi:hypothetical protein
MSYSSILALLKTQLEAVTGIGKVHDYFRYSESLQKEAHDLFISGGIFHTWMITRVSFDPEAQTSFLVERAHAFDFWGFYQVNDSEASEKTFQALCDTICDKFDDDGNVVLSDSVDQPARAQLLNFDIEVKFMGVLCHRAQIRITAYEEFDGGA